MRWCVAAVAVVPVWVVARLVASSTLRCCSQSFSRCLPCENKNSAQISFPSLSPLFLSLSPLSHTHRTPTLKLRFWQKNGGWWWSARAASCLQLCQQLQQPTAQNLWQLCQALLLCSSGSDCSFLGRVVVIGIAVVAVVIAVAAGVAGTIRVSDSSTAVTLCFWLRRKRWRCARDRRGRGGSSCRSCWQVRRPWWWRRRWLSRGRRRGRSGGSRRGDRNEGRRVLLCSVCFEFADCCLECVHPRCFLFGCFGTHNENSACCIAFHNLKALVWHTCTKQQRCLSAP